MLTPQAHLKAWLKFAGKADLREAAHHGDDLLASSVAERERQDHLAVGRAVLAQLFQRLAHARRQPLLPMRRSGTTENSQHSLAQLSRSARSTSVSFCRRQP